MFDVLLITGAAGTGKTSTARAWALSRHGVAAHLSHDDLMLNVKSGLVSPSEEATAEAERQWRIALNICVAASQIYAAAQVRCAIDTFLLPIYLSLWNHLAQFQVGLIVLHPTLETAIARNTARIRETGWGVPTWQIQANHAAMAEWSRHSDVLMLDNSQLTLDQVIAAINDWERDRNIGLYLETPL